MKNKIIQPRIINREIHNNKNPEPHIGYNAEKYLHLLLKLKSAFRIS